MSWLTVFRRKQSFDLSHRILGREELQVAIEKERLRCDRNGSQFCFVKMELRHDEDRAHHLEVLGKVLCDRLRRTDEIGKVHASVLGVLLPETPVFGAWKVIDDVVALLPLTVEPPHCSVYCYPTEFELNQLSDRKDRLSNKEERIALPLEHLLCQATPAWKRAFDLAGAGFGLLVLSPLLLLVAIAVKLSSPGPLFFFQERMGRGGRPFQMIKFRTMRNGAHLEQAALRIHSEQDGPAFKLSNDPRMTWVGRYLRRTCVDEVPQLWNVLRGEMSLVGPRPLPCEESHACERWQKRRLDVTPGLTCTWQVSKRSQIRFVDWMRLDLQYAQKRSLMRDLYLIMQTFRVVMGGQGK